MRRALLGFALTWLAAALVCAQPGAEASAAPAASADYEVALAEALAAHARGDYVQARMFMERAHQLEPSARTLRGLGIVAFAQARHADAIRCLDAALASPVKALPLELRASVEELLAHAWAQVGRYELRVDADGGDVVIDGAAPDFYAPQTVILTPGVHRVGARAPARIPHELTITVQPGEQRSLYIVLSMLPAPAPAQPSPGPGAAQAAAAEPAAFWTPARRWVSIGTAGALVVSGAVLWGLAYGRLQRVAQDCRDHADGVCTEREAVGAYRGENVEGLGISAAVLLSAGAAALLTVGVIEIWHASSGRARGATFGLRAGVGSAALEARF